MYLEILELSFLPAGMKKIQSKLKALERSQYYTLIFKHSGTGNCLVSGQILLKFKLIQALMHVLVACKNEDDPSKNEGGARVCTTFLLLFVYGDFFRRSREVNSEVGSCRNSYSSKLLWLSSLPVRIKKI